ncbi:sel1 repeat family protein [bacterium]|nr:sel1 repeat family protein [bacterium]
MIILLTIMLSLNELNDKISYFKERGVYTYIVGMLESLNPIFDKDETTEIKNKTYVEPYINHWSDIVFETLPTLENRDSIEKEYIQNRVNLQTEIVNDIVINCYKKRDKDSLIPLRKEALKGNPLAQIWLGVILNEFYKNDSEEGKIWITIALNSGYNPQNGLDYIELISFALLSDLGIGFNKSVEYAYTWMKYSETHPIAKLYIGEYLYFGYGVTKNRVESVEYFLNIAEEGFFLGDSWLGFIYGNYPKLFNSFKSFNYYKSGAEKGDISSLRNLGELYLNGIGVQKDIKLAIEYFEKAAKENDTKSMLWLGYTYSNYFNSKESLDKAIAWYEKVALLGDGEAAYNIGIIYWDNKNFSKGEEWLLKSGELGWLEGYVSLGEFYLHGMGVEINENMAFELFYMASKGKDPSGLLFTGYCYQYGKGVEKNILEARRYYEESIRLGERDALFYLGLTYFEEKAYITALSWFLKKELSGYPPALVKIGEIYMEGLGVDVDKAKGFLFFSSAAKMGYGNGFSWLGYCYENGFGTELDIDKAIESYKKGAELGDEYAKEQLKRVLKK